MISIDVSGMLTAVEFAGFVALNMVKVKEPSPFVVSLVILIVGSTSSFRIVPSPWVSVIVHPSQFDKFTKNVSSGSTVRSPFTATFTVRVSGPPAVNVRLPPAPL